MSAINGLKPASLWKHFENLTKIPRCSKHESQVLQHIIDFAKRHNLEYREDEVGNLLVKRPGSGGGERAPIVALQGHVDMVCEKNRDVELDFTFDGLTLKREGDYLMADGTTLGADNGIGVAAMMALLEAPGDALLPPLECLFTVDEETGLTGAFALASNMLDARIMLNTDTEEWGALYVGCAGGGDQTLHLPMKWDPILDNTVTCEVTVEGLLGGHSGVDIHEERANALKFLARLLYRLSNERLRYQLISLASGDKHNAIPREAIATIAISRAKIPMVLSLLNTWIGDLRAEYGSKEPGLNVRCEVIAQKATQALRKTHRDRLLSLLCSLHHGVVKYSHDIPGLVETSNSIASIKAVDDEYQIVTSTRSSVSAALDAHRDAIGLIAAANSAKAERHPAYPGWQPDLDSEVLKLTKEVYKELHGEYPEVKAIHAGLECGIIGEKFPGMDTISLGPTIQYPHSPGERVEISTVELFWNLLRAVLDKYAAQKA